MYDEKLVSIKNLIEHFEKNIFFKDVHLFMTRLKKISVIKELELVRDNV